MALIKVGSIGNFAVTPIEELSKERPFVKGIKTISDLKEISRGIPSDTFKYLTSQDKRGITLKKIKLLEGFEGFLQKYLNPTNEIYFLAWTWDLSGQPVNFYPGTISKPEDVIIPIKVGKERMFVGSGINLFPKNEVTGGICVRIQVWESDQKARDFGQVISEMADTISKSKLNSLLSLLSLATGVPAITVNMIKEASIELAKILGYIMTSNDNDYVDLFEGYFPSDLDWIVEEKTYCGQSSEITLNTY